MPYRSGFSMEFPPGAIPALAVPALPRSHYVSWFKAFELLCAAAAIGAVAYALAGTPRRRRYGAVVVAGVAPAVLGPIALNSFDLWPSALAAWAVALVVRGRPRWGLALLGAATAAKLYPVLLAPALLTYVARERGRDEARRALLAAAAVVFVVFAPFAAVAPGGLRASLQQQATRGLQVESLGGSILGVAHRLGAGYHVVVSHSPFSFDVAGRGAGVLATVLSLLVLIGDGGRVAACFAEGPGRPRPHAARRRRDRRRLRRLREGALAAVPALPRPARAARRLGRGVGGPAARARADAGVGAVPGAVPPDHAPRRRDLGRARAEPRARRALRAARPRPAPQTQHEERVERKHHEVARDDPPRERCLVVLSARTPGRVEAVEDDVRERE